MKRPAGPAALAALLLLAGLLQAAAATVRWAPCLADPAGLACALRQNHTLDYQIVSEPFEAIPVAVPLAGVASLLLAGFWMLAATVPAADTVAPRVLCRVTAAVFALVGVSQLAAAASDAQFGVFGYGPGLVVWLLATAAPVVTAAVLAVRSPGIAAKAAWGLVLVSAVAGNPLVEYVVLQPLNPSYDSPAGAGSLGAAALLVAGAAFAVVAIRGGERGGELPRSQPAQAPSSPFS